MLLAADGTRLATFPRAQRQRMDLAHEESAPAQAAAN
jgi:hypothetical protein